MMDSLTSFLVVAIVVAIVASFQGSDKVHGREFLRLCYFTNWSKHRSSPYAKFDIKDIDPHLCTHLVYAFAHLDTVSRLMVPEQPLVEDSRPGYTGRYQQFTDLKRRNKNLKTLISLGGEHARNEGFKALLASDVILERFAKNAVDFLRKRNFDGLDIDWEFPNKETRNGYIRLLKALRQAMDADPRGSDLILTAAASAGKGTIDVAYDIPSMARYVTFVSLMTYDYYVAGNEVAAFNSPLYSRKDIQFNPTYSTNWTVHYWMERGMPASKLLVGVTGMGRRFVLANENDTLVGAKVTKESRPGDFYGVGSSLAYPEICQMLASMSTVRVFDYEQHVPYLVRGDDWVGYEDEQSLKAKVEWMLKIGVAGVMMWSLDQDDFTGQACERGKFPLLTTIRNTVKKDVTPDLTPNVNRNIHYITGRNGGAHLQTTWSLAVCLSVVVGVGVRRLY